MNEWADGVLVGWGYKNMNEWTMIELVGGWANECMIELLNETVHVWCLYFSASLHRERRNYLRTALQEMALILSDQPGLVGPKV